MTKVLLSPSSIGQCGSQPMDLLLKNGYEIIPNPFGRKLTPEETIELAKDAAGVVAGVETYDKSVLDSLPNLKCISRVGVGMDSIDLDYAQERGVIIKNTPFGPTKAVAELSIALAMNLLRNIGYSDRSIREGVWKKSIGNLIEDKEVGILGLGRIGKATAMKYQALGCRVSAYDLYPDEKWMSENGVLSKSFEEVLKNSDLISIHVPGGSFDGAVIGRAELNLVKHNAVLINLSRGGVVDEAALFDFLKKNETAKAALDVFSEEPYSGPFTKLENVVLTPHLGSYAKEGKLAMEVDAVKNLMDALEETK
ncbi:phosphoglycerate dehydrogenase [Cryomorphaceae bacterium]|nr:phosphoglycerate dehydrogenase [Cryomorphaceae bacterium]